MTLFFIATFLSAFLLFQVQPIMGKVILPWFGGGANIWTTCLLFYQSLLVLGYAYAHWLASMSDHRRQALIHIIVLLSACALLPIIPNPSLKPTDPSFPVLRILVLLLATNGVPYFVLSTNGPLLQSWFSRSHADHSPYRLYALSNAGSLVGLLSYPFFLEPNVSLKNQAVYWSGGFLLCVVLLVSIGWILRRRAFAEEQAPVGKLFSFAESTKSTVLSWFFLSFTGSLLLVSITNQLTENVPPIPFLWIAPLCLYLISFILCFESERFYSRSVWTAGLPVVLVAGIALYAGNPRIGYRESLLGYLLILAIGTIVCHGELYRRRPDPSSLTFFYLVLSVGAACGSFFVIVMCPLLFTGYYEFPLGLIALAVIWSLWVSSSQLKASQMSSRVMRSGFVVLFTAIAIHFSLGSSNALVEMRNFYGVLRVVDSSAVRVLFHGQLIHGGQFRDPQRKLDPLFYYGPGSGLYRLFGSLRSRAPGEPLRIGVVGMGVGVISAFTKAGDNIRYYEINPQVEEIARVHFSFVSDSAAEHVVVLGDARTMLEGEQSQQFDILVLDAFNSDAVPMHLLTEEAFAIYQRHLAPDGVIAVQLSSDHLDLGPVIRAHLKKLKMFGRRYIAQSDLENGLIWNDWVILSSSNELFRDQQLEAGKPLVPLDSRPWTDDYSNLLKVIKW